MWMTIREFAASVDAPAAAIVDVWDDVVGFEPDAIPEQVEEMRARLAERASS